MAPVFLLLVLCFSAFHESCGTIFTSLAHLDSAATLEKDLVDSLQKYIAAEEERLLELSEFVKEAELENLKARQDVSGYVANPINSYLLIKRLFLDWAEAVNTTAEQLQENDLDLKSTVDSHDALPDEDDLVGASLAMMRLQNTYSLDLEELARGNIQGNKVALLRPSDFLDIGKVAYDESDYYNSALWLEAALKILEEAQMETSEEKNRMRVETMEYLAHTYYVNDNMEKAIELYRKIVAEDPNHSYASDNVAVIEEQLGRLKKEGRAFPTQSFKRKNPGGLANRDKYESLCRGKRDMPLAEQAKLKCFYVDNGNVHLTIQPVKMEVVNLIPWIVMFHDVITDGEIEFMKKKAVDQLERSGVVREGTGDSALSEFRVSSGTFFEFPYPDPHPILERLNRRISYITGLSTKTAHPKAHAESFQVVNYGIGGVYEPHFDYALLEDNEEDVFLKGSGNRIATWMYYLSGVKAGGYTVFPEADSFVPPIKNSAVFWYNLKKSGEGDEMTRHAGCPVLLGNKWVTNKWIHQVGQEFIARCGADSEDRFKNTLHV